MTIITICTENYRDAIDFVLPSWLRHADKVAMFTDFKYSDPDSRVHVHNTIKKNTSYATIAYEYGPFDMIFIDGRRRVECAIVAKQVISPGGVIMLHDKNRENYMRPLRPHIKIIEEGEKTIVFR